MLLAVAQAGEWVLQPSTTATVIVGVGAAGDTAIAGASENGGGAVVEFFDGAKWAKTKLGGGLLLDAAVSSDASLKVVTSLLPVFISDNGGDYVKSTSIGGDFMSATIFGDAVIGLVGGFVVDGGKKSVNGVAVSNDRGQTWIASDVPASYSRYGAFVDASTMYVSAGTWGADNSTAASSSDTVYLSMTTTAADSAPRHRRIKIRGQKEGPPAHLGDASVNANGWMAVVSKTTDGGKTWTEVFRLPEGEMYYFNGISCTTADHCVVVGEGETPTDPFLTVAFTTFDGGVTWAQSFSSTALFSLMSVSMTSETAGWMAGVAKQKGTLVGQFYTTSDGGASWQLQQSLSDCYPLDMAFSSGGGVASCSSSSGASSTIATYVA